MWGGLGFPLLWRGSIVCMRVGLCKKGLSVIPSIKYRIYIFSVLIKKCMSHHLTCRIRETKRVKTPPVNPLFILRFLSPTNAPCWPLALNEKSMVQCKTTESNALAMESCTEPSNMWAILALIHGCVQIWHTSVNSQDLDLQGFNESMQFWKF